MNPDLGTELRSGRVISSSSETHVQTDPDMAQSSANDSDSNEVSDISSQLSEIKESYERKINELQNEFSQLKDLMMAVISKTDTENRQSTSKGPSKPTHTVGLDNYIFANHSAPNISATAPLPVTAVGLYSDNSCLNFRQMAGSRGSGYYS